MILIQQKKQAQKKCEKEKIIIEKIEQEKKTKYQSSLLVREDNSNAIKVTLTFPMPLVYKNICG